MVIIYTLLITTMVFISLRWYLSYRRFLNSEQALLARKKELGYLLSIIKEANETDQTLEERFTRNLNRLRDELNWSYLSIFRLVDERQILVIRFTGYLPNWYMEDLSKRVFVKVGDASVGRAVSTKQPAIVNSAEVDPRFQNVTAFAQNTGYKSLSCYPLMGRTKVIGGFCAYSVKEAAFSLHDIEFLLTVSNLFTAIIENDLLAKSSST